MLDWAVDTESPKAGGPRTRGINGEAASLMRTQRYSYILSNVARLLLSKPVFWFFVSPNTPQNTWHPTTSTTNFLFFFFLSLVWAGSRQAPVWHARLLWPTQTPCPCANPFGWRALQWAWLSLDS